jgi:hypothetical protein
LGGRECAVVDIAPGGRVIEITVAPPPIEGQESTVTITDDLGRGAAGLTVRVMHRPGLTGAQEVAIGITDSLGRVRWNPDQPGSAELRVDDEALPVAIGWAHWPIGTLLLLAWLAAAATAMIGFGLSSPRRWKPRESP